MVVRARKTKQWCVLALLVLLASGCGEDGDDAAVVGAGNTPSPCSPASACTVYPDVPVQYLLRQDDLRIYHKQTGDDCSVLVKTQYTEASLGLPPITALLDGAMVEQARMLVDTGASGSLPMVAPWEGEVVVHFPATAQASCDAALGAGVASFLDGLTINCQDLGCSSEPGITVTRVNPGLSIDTSRAPAELLLVETADVVMVVRTRLTTDFDMDDSISPGAWEGYQLAVVKYSGVCGGWGGAYVSTPCRSIAFVPSRIRAYSRAADDVAIVGSGIGGDDYFPPLAIIVPAGFIPNGAVPGAVGADTWDMLPTPYALFGHPYRLQLDSLDWLSAATAYNEVLPLPLADALWASVNLFETIAFFPYEASDFGQKVLHLFVGMNGDAVSPNYINPCDGCYDYESSGVFRIDFDAVLFPSNVVAPELL